MVADLLELGEDAQDHPLAPDAVGAFQVRARLFHHRGIQRACSLVRVQ